MVKRLFILWMLACLVTVVPAQQNKKTAVQKKTVTTKQRAAGAGKVAPSKKSGKSGSSGKSNKSGKSVSTPQKPSVSVSSLKNEQAQVRRQIKEQERRLQENERDVKKRLQNLMVINNEIADKRKTIDTIRNDISRLNGDIEVLENQLQVLNLELEERKQRFLKSMRYMQRNRGIQSQMMFIFSAKNFSQMYRRLRFVREYASYQQAQGEAVQAMQAQVKEAFDDLASAKKLKSDLLYRDELEKKSLESKQVEQEQVVNSLKKQQKTIQGIIDKQRKRDADLNTRIDKMIAEEIARAKARAEAEAKRKAAEEAAKKRAEEQARKKTIANTTRKENGRVAPKTVKARKETERKAAPAKKSSRERESVGARTSANTSYTVSTVDRKLSGNFEGNRGRLPMPIVGSYKIVNRFGTNRVTDVKGQVTLDKKGIDIQGQPGAQVQCIFDGEVSAVFGYSGTTVVIVRHGSYLSVYCDLASVSVSRGQKVSTRQALGRVGSSGMMQFQLRHGSAKLNPEQWLRR